jgi:anti-sigma regulatory factor (Ser/Thr protein kinase)
MMPPECVVHMPLRACTFRFAGRVDQVGRARGFVAEFLEEHPGADDAVLLVSELAANACSHSASGRPGGAFEVRVVVGVEGWVRVAERSSHPSLDDKAGTPPS